MTWTLVKVQTTPTGTVLVNPDGTVRSLNPATTTGGPYHWETRPPGTNGGYERCEMNGSAVVYNPLGIEAVVYGFQAKVPNCEFSAITVEPLE
jgi:hypothetical protein